MLREPCEKVVHCADAGRTAASAPTMNTPVRSQASPERERTLLLSPKAVSLTAEYHQIRRRSPIDRQLDRFGCRVILLGGFSMSEPEQSFKSHARWQPLFHFFVMPVLLANVVN